MYRVCFDGTPGNIAWQQDWKIDSRYLNADYDQHSEAEIRVCDCSYPYFLCLLDDFDSQRQPITCLVDYYGEIINHCPNCGAQLVDDEDDDYFEVEDNSVPPPCQGCCNYHGETYGHNLLICAMHPYGWDGDVCPDYEKG